MKFATVILAAGFLFAGSAFADHHNTGAEPAKAAAGAEKKARKKKAQMCAECGKAESECECHGKKDGQKHAEGDGHGH